MARLSDSHGTFDRDEQFVLGKWFGQVAAHAGPTAILYLLGKYLRGHSDKRDLAASARQCPDAARRLEPVHAGHAHVHQNHVIIRDSGRLNRLPAALDASNRMTSVSQECAGNFPVHGNVVDNEQIQFSYRRFRPARRCRNKR